jgi:hypothetical protein
MQSALISTMEHNQMLAAIKRRGYGEARNVAGLGGLQLPYVATWAGSHDILL